MCAGGERRRRIRIADPLLPVDLGDRDVRVAEEEEPAVDRTDTKRSGGRRRALRRRLVEFGVIAGTRDDGTTIAPLLERYPDFAALIETGPDEAAFERLRRAESIGRPLGDDGFISRLEALTQRALKPRKRGPKPSAAGDPSQGELNGLSQYF